MRRGQRGTPKRCDGTRARFGVYLPRSRKTHTYMRETGNTPARRNENRERGPGAIKPRSHARARVSPLPGRLAGPQRANAAQQAPLDWPPNTVRRLPNTARRTAATQHNGRGPMAVLAIRQ